MLEEDEILDYQPKPKRRFNKNPVLYGLVTICFIGFFFQRMHWPGHSLMIIIGGGLSVGYICGLFVYFKQHFFFENAGMFLYASFITFTILRNFVVEGWLIYAVTLGLSFLISALLLRGKEII